MRDGPASNPQSQRERLIATMPDCATRRSALAYMERPARDWRVEYADGRVSRGLTRADADELIAEAEWAHIDARATNECERESEAD